MIVNNCEWWLLVGWKKKQRNKKNTNRKEVENAHDYAHYGQKMGFRFLKREKNEPKRRHEH